MEYFVGPGLHTVLKARRPIGFHGLGTRQPTMVLTHVEALDKAIVLPHVLEVGCGKGYCTLFLADLAQRHVYFHGVDLVEKHVRCADADNCHGARVQFHVGDAHAWECPGGLKFDLIFGCESMCHLDPDVFVAHAASMMNPGARLVIIDGFRGRHWNLCSDLCKDAMRLAERGFRVNAMPTKAAWKSACDAHGLRLVRDVDMTEEATPFWAAGCRLASAIMCLPWLVRLYMRSSRARRETVGNVVACAMVAHALAGGSAEYGMLVFENSQLM